MPIVTKRRASVSVGLLALIAAGTTAYLTLETSPTGRAYPPANTRTTINFTACMLTPPTGNDATPQSEAAWQGLLKAQASTNIRVQTFATQGTETLQNAQTAVNTLALRGCNLITAATPVETAAIEHQAHLFPTTRFAVITTEKAAPHPGNTTIEAVGPADQITTEVSELTSSTLRSHS